MSNVSLDRVAMSCLKRAQKQLSEKVGESVSLSYVVVRMFESFQK